MVRIAATALPRVPDSRSCAIELPEWRATSSLETSATVSSGGSRMPQSMTTASSPRSRNRSRM